MDVTKHERGQPADGGAAGDRASPDAGIALSPLEVEALSDALASLRGGSGPSIPVRALSAFEPSGGGGAASVVLTLAVLGHEYVLRVQDRIESSRSAGSGCELPAYALVLVLDLVRHAGRGAAADAPLVDGRFTDPLLDDLHARARDSSIASA